MRIFLAGFMILALAMPAIASAHAFPDKSSPRAGATITKAPAEAKVWFDGEIEPVFSTLIVKNAAGTQVSQGKGTVDASHHTLLETPLPKKLPAGTYTVYWSVIAHDGHHTAGHFTFTVK